MNTLNTLSAGTITGDTVKNTAGEDLGKIEEIMIDTSSGKVAYAVLSFGGFLGMGDKFFAVPWKSLQLSKDEHAFYLDVPKDKLEKAPGFNKDNWPSSADHQFLSNIYDYYGHERYWETKM